jgi:hypothetical protein
MWLAMRLVVSVGENARKIFLSAFFAANNLIWISCKKVSLSNSDILSFLLATGVHSTWFQNTLPEMTPLLRVQSIGLRFG